MLVAIVENPAAGSYIKGALLLFFRALNKILVTHNLEPEEPSRDGAGPQQEKKANDPEAGALERDSARSLGSAAYGLDGCRHRD
jgi:hypothetical protein